MSEREEIEHYEHFNNRECAEIAAETSGRDKYIRDLEAEYSRLIEALRDLAGLLDSERYSAAYDYVHDTLDALEPNELAQAVQLRLRIAGLVRDVAYDIEPFQDVPCGIDGCTIAPAKFCSRHMRRADNE